MKKLLFPIFLFFSLSLNAHQLPPGFAAVQIADGLDPVDMALAPDGRIFLTEKFGRVMIVENGILLPDPFLEIEVDNFNERGLSGIAIDPEFDQNGYVYLYYTVPNANHNRISRFIAEGNFALPGSEETLLELPPLGGPHHNAGAMDFGPDGKLYIAVGDGFSTAVSQNMNSILGKILRINPDGSIPDDNPFFDQTEGKAKAIWAVGFRNPFAMTVQPETGRFFATEVGSFRFEEINEILAGKNYGWPIIEGQLIDEVPPPNYADPIFTYNHNAGCAATGVEFYDPQAPLFPTEYRGQLFISDYCSGKISTLDPDTGEATDFASEIDRPLNLLTAHDGTLYYIARGGTDGGSALANTSSSEGQLWRIFYTGNDAPFIAVQPKPQLVPMGESAVFESSASGAAPLFFQWQKNGSDIAGATSPTLVLNNLTLADSGSVVRCIVTNAEGADTTQLAEIQVTTNQRPNLEIISPTEGTSYQAGDALVFRGEADDPEEGDLSPENFRWKIDFHHDSHTHPALGPISGVSGDTLFIPKAGEVSDNVYFRINFTATDSEGLSRTAQRLVYPKKTNFTVETSPPGLPIETNGNFSATPYVVPSVVGVVHQLKAAFTQVGQDSFYTFKAWSTGQNERQILFEAPENDTVLTAIYRSRGALADGQGLRAFYFDDPTEVSEFTEPFAFSRIDPQVKFDWVEGSPNSFELGTDHFLVRWEGCVQSLVEDSISFHTISDDGVRLWVDGQLLIDEWRGQSREEHIGTIFMEAEKFYDIKLEYFEGVGEAFISLLWSGPNLERDFVPTEQLFPVHPRQFFGDESEVTVFPNPVGELLTVDIGSPTEQLVKATLFNALGQIFYEEKTTLNEGYSRLEIDFGEQPHGLYFLSIEGEGISQIIEIAK